MNTNATTHFSFLWSKPIDINLSDISQFWFENQTPNAVYNLPSFHTYLFIKYYEIPATTGYELEGIELDNVDFAMGDEGILENDELIRFQNEHDADLLKPFNISAKKRSKIIFK